jgi:RNA polymerase sigma factor (sigma-70 family)
MAKPSPSGSRPPAPGLDQISTRWRLITDPEQFVLRYAPAIHKYLEALLKNAHDAEEVAQDFLLRSLQKGFVPPAELRGRFRDYLKVAVRNTALNHLRRKKPSRAAGPLDQAADAEPDAAEREWLAEWQRCVLDRAWQALDSHQGRSPGNLFYTVLRLSADHPQDDSATLAARATALAGRPLRADAFRKQLSRARRLFAELLVKEVALTLETATPGQVEEELSELGLLPYVRDFLPPDWRSRGKLTDPE